MCFHSEQSKSAKELEKRFNAKVKDLIKSSIFNGFDHPKTPIITNLEPNLIQNYTWGLIPSWCKDKSIQNSTLNAKIETLNDKPSFKNYLQNRCLIIADSFYEWQWQDSKGKKKIKHKIHMPGNELFTFAGLWNIWTSPENEIIETYTIITTEANEFMSKIHNSGKRMPYILSQENEKNWLLGNEIAPQIIDLQAIPIYTENPALTLFDL